MNKQLLKEIQKLRYLNTYDRGITLNENKLLVEQLGPFLVKQGWKGIVDFGLEHAIKLTVDNLSKYFGKDILASMDSLIAKAIQKGRLAKGVGMFQGEQIGLKLALFRNWVKDMSTESLTILERNIFYEAIASIDETFNKTLLADILETAEGKLLKSGTMSDEAFEKMVKNINSPLYGFSETFLRQVAKTGGGMDSGLSKLAKEAQEKLSKTIGEITASIDRTWKKTGTWIGGTGLFKPGPAISEKISYAMIEKHVAKLAGYSVANIPKALEKLGLNQKSLQIVITAIQNGTPIPASVVEEIYILLLKDKKIFNEIYETLGKKKMFGKDLHNFLDKAFLEGSEDITQQQIKAIKKILGQGDNHSDELAIMLLKRLQSGSWVKQKLVKFWYVKGTNTSKFMNFITCGRKSGMKAWGFAGIVCTLFRIHLVTSLTPWVNERLSFNALISMFKDSNKKDDDKLDSIEDILDPNSKVVADLNDVKMFEFLGPDQEIKSLAEVNEYYDLIAEAIGTKLLTFVPKDAETGLGFIHFREDPTDPININSVYDVSNGRGRWYTGPSLSALNNYKESDWQQAVLSWFSSDWNNIDEEGIENLLVSRPSQFGLAKVAERYAVNTGNKRSLWDDLDQLEYGDGFLQNALSNLLLHNDVTKHSINLEKILGITEYAKNDMPGALNIVEDPSLYILDGWWHFPTRLYDVIDVMGDLAEVEYYPEYTGEMPKNLYMEFLQEGSFELVGLDGETSTVKITSQEDLYDVPARAFNDFLEKNALGVFKKALYHHPYLYSYETIGTDANGLEVKEWVTKNNPEYTSTPKNSGVADEIKKYWNKKKKEIEEEADDINEGNTDDEKE